MGNEMGNNNTSGLKDEENTTVEACKTSLVDTTHVNDTKEEHQLVPEVEGKDFHEKVANLACGDPVRIGDRCVKNQTSSLEEHENTEVHPLGETPKVIVVSTEAGERDSKLQSDTSLNNDPGHGKPIEKNMEETDLQGTMQYQLEKQDSLKKEDEEDGTISTSDDLEPKENVTVEACQTSLLDNTQENDTNEENQIGAEVEENDFHEKVAYLATNDQKMTEDPCNENQTSSTKEQEDTEVHPLGELPQVTMESNEVREEDGEVQPVTLSSDSGHEEPIEQKKKGTDIQAGTMQYHLDKQDCLKKEDEEDGSISASHALEAIEYKSFESNQQELVTIHADQSVEVGSESLPGSKDCLGPSFTSDLEANGDVLDTETFKNMEESADTGTDPALERWDALSLEQKACEGLLKSSEEQFETKDLEEVENGFTNITQIASYDLLGLENNCNMELPTEVNLIDSSKSEPEAFLVSNSQLEVPQPKEKCIILKEEIRLTGKELENGEKKHYTNQIQPSLQSGMESEPDCDKSSEPQFESTMVEPTHEKSETVSVISPLSNKVVEDDNLVLMRLNNQHEASEDQCYQESERKLEVVLALGIISPELTIPHFSHKEEELVGKRTVQEREDNMEPLLASEMEETEGTEQDCLPPEKDTVFGNETVQSINDSIPEVKQENSGEFLATENPTIDFTSWIAEALVSMNNLEAEMLSQQVTQHNEPHQAEAAAAAESKTLVEVETSSVSVSSGSETLENVGRSSTVSTESDPDNLNIVHAQIQKSPSFSLDLQNEARTEESDSTPLLYQDKAEIESSASQGEKVITLERSESEESKTPFLGFLKEEEETHVVVVAQNKHENHSPSKNSKRNLCDSVTGKAAPTSSKGKEKRRNRASLFSNCLCCATVIN
ncbi:uncharacterized protein LOC112200372 [Rosa chinensis]|uniref:uncharacterized protein LOC112200372 n=1 Tax=Rosa chinensis TaxID=74649 RepID=UPI000D09613E|nr:uncharacterized protein LOC112200372 [Rosa chinensis]XP_024197167.1 uncharacterized protein LOC112200372 [Rosa chinensis]XP_040375020.1 uncharacterized protein LOC112200372 [Rosa chinensis]XP_040375021.1 uncharacterized protein LOC112200372 [Rosa chinensis]XP_040375022.1 uncharacterized protein LOC112200372 [Rosa chinensis]